MTDYKERLDECADWNRNAWGPSNLHNCCSEAISIARELLAERDDAKYLLETAALGFTAIAEDRDRLRDGIENLDLDKGAFTDMRFHAMVLTLRALLEDTNA